MGEALGTIIFIAVSLILVAVVGSIIMSILGLFFGIVVPIVKLAVIAGLIYLAFVAYQKMTKKAY